MRISERWLREWVDPPLDTQALARCLTMAGHEVEAVHREGTELEGVVVGEVLAVASHPDADRLSVCRVSIGNGDAVDVVCGAANVRAGMKSPFAGPGTRLPNGTELRRTKIRGVVSNGMLCSAVELALGEESDGILELPASARSGTPLAEVLGFPDAVLDVNLTPNRGDCFSVRGLARDLAAASGQALLNPIAPSVKRSIRERYEVVVETAAACPRFAGRVIRGIDAHASSPLWMAERLRRSGIRTIHPVVDVTNYVMLELGQPLHAYDLARLRGPIRPRFATAGETLVLLDERRVELREDTLLITDDSGPIGLAGIMGGLSTAVSRDTGDVFFEAAFWPPAVIAGRARNYALHTDASVRFERGVDPTVQALAVDRATELLLEVAGGKAGPLVDVQHKRHLPERRNIPLRMSRLRRVLGADASAPEVRKILASLELAPRKTREGWSVTCPAFRFDLQIEHDLIEEVARIYGYDRIPETTEVVALPLQAVSETRTDLERIADTLVARDYREVVTYSFVDARVDSLLAGTESELVLSNPIASDMGVMRGSLWCGLIQAAAENFARQRDRVRLFEIGRSYHGSVGKPVEVLRVAGLIAGTALAEQWAVKSERVDFFDIKSDVAALLGLTGCAQDFTFAAASHPALQSGQAAEIKRNGSPAGFLGKLHPAVARVLDFRRDAFLFELDAEVAFAAAVPASVAVSKFPSVRRDIAVLVKEEVSAAELVAAVSASAPALIREVRIFDVYRGPGVEAGLKSVALGLILQETSRTLTDRDADSATDGAVRKLQQQFGAVLRD